MSQVSDKDLGWSEIKRQLAKLDRQSVAVGVLAPDGSALKKESTPDGEKISRRTDVLTVAMAHEFGAPSQHIPQRSFLRLTMDTRRAQVNGFIEREYGRVLSGQMGASQALMRLGALFQGYVFDTFRSEGGGQWDALSARTIAARLEATGRVKILVDTGQLRQSIHWEIRGAD